jgi:hypothetical protein
MMEKERLRKADVFCGGIIFLFGAWIVWQAFNMPMKDSWGGVQNVWFVSPALFPLFVGSMVMLLGALLSRTAIRMVGRKEIAATTHWLLSRSIIPYLTSESTLRFYAIAVLFLSFVYMNIPRVDFFLSATLFLVVFITMFYFGDAVLFKKLFSFYLAGVAGFLIYFGLGIGSSLGRILPYPGDVLVLCYLVGYCAYAWILVRSNAALRKKYRTSLIIALSAPLVVCPIFKYFLLVPLPTEGLVVAFLDSIWYLEF